MASRDALACTVVIEPSWPVFMAWSMSSASAARHSPTMMRSGRMRRAFLTRSRIDTVPVPSADAGRVSRLITCGCCSWSSAESSIVMIRSPSGMNAESTLRFVVLPVPVPPDTRMFSLPLTHASMTVTRSRVHVPKLMRSLAVHGSLENFRIVSTEPCRASGGMMAFDAGAVGEAGVDHRRGLVDPATHGRDDLVDHGAVLDVVAERQVGALDEAAALHPDVVVGVAHHLGDGVVGEERVEGSVPEGVGHHLLHEATALERA